MSLLPKSSTKKYLSLLFSENTLTIIKVNSRGNKLEQFNEFPMPSGLIVNGEVKDKDSLGKFLAQIKLQLKIDKEFIIVGIPEERSFTRTLILPPIEVKEINEAVKYQADSFLPFPYKNEYLDWMLIESLEDGKKKILISAIPKNIIDSFIDILEKSNLYPVAFETSAISLLRAIPQESKKLCLAVEISDPVSLVIFCHNNTIEASSVIKESSQIIVTIKQIIDFYFKDKGKVETPKDIFLCGKNISQNFINDLKNIGLESKLLNLNISSVPQGKETEYVLPLSLACKSVTPPEDEKSINIISNKQLGKYENIFQEKKERGIKLTLIVLLIILNAGLFIANIDLKSKISKYKQSVSISNEDLSSLKDLTYYSSKSLILNRLTHNQTLFQNLWNIFGETKLVSITGLNYSQEKKEIVITGHALLRDDLSKFKYALEKNKYFSKVTIPLSSLEKEANIDFRILLTPKI